MRILVLIVLASFISFHAHTQDTIFLSQQPRDLLFESSHFGFSIIPLVNQKAKVDPVSGPYRLKSTPVRGVEAGFDYHYNFNDRYSIIVGIHGGVSVRNLSLTVPKEDFTPAEKEDFIVRGEQTADLYLSAPFLFEYRWRVKKRNFWNVQGGVNLRFYPDQIEEGMAYAKSDGFGGYYDIIDVDLEVGRNFKPWIDYNLAGGYTMTLKNWNFLRANLLFNFSNKSIASGYYKINVAGKPVSEGGYASRHSFIGLSLGYTWTGNKRRVRKQMEISSRYR